MIFPADPIGPPGATSVVSMQSELGDDPPDNIVFVVFLIFTQTLIDLLQKLTVPL